MRLVIIASNKTVVFNYRLMLFFAVIITGDRSSPNINIFTYNCIT